MFRSPDFQLCCILAIYTIYVQPLNSVHLDATTMIDVVVDIWLTEEEYKLVRDRGDLGWQIITPTPVPLNVDPTAEDQTCPTLCVKTSSYRKEDKLPFPSCSPNEPGRLEDPWCIELEPTNES